MTSRWYLSRPEWLGPRFFQGSPLRSYFFFVDTLLLVLAVLFNVFVLARYWTATRSFTHFWLCVNLWAMILFWLKCWQYHGRIRQLYRTGAISEMQHGSPQDVIMQTTGSLMTMGLLYFLMVSIGLLNLMANILHGRG